jgi:hypothetical protein
LVLAKEFYGDPKSLAEYIGNWGPSAVPVLITLYGDDRWQAFRPVMMRLLAAAESPEAGRFLLHRLGNLLSKPERNEEETQELRNFAWNAGERLGTDAVRIVREPLRALGAKPQPSAGELSDASRICELLAATRSAEAADLLAEQARRGSDAFRETCLRNLLQVRAQQAITLGRRLLTETQDEAVKKRMTEFIETGTAHARAQEPMSRILEQQRKERHP